MPPGSFAPNQKRFPGAQVVYVMDYDSDAAVSGGGSGGTVTIGSVTLQSGTNTIGTVLIQGTAGMTAVKTDGSAVTQPVSAVVLPLPDGAATQATLATLLTDTQLRANPLPVALNGSLPSGTNVIGKVEITNPSSGGGIASSVEVTNFPATLNADFGEADDAAASTDAGIFPFLSLFKRLLGRVTVLIGLFPTSLTASGGVKVDNSDVTQPISVETLPLPLGAASQATLATLLTDTQLRALALSVTGPLTDAQLRAAALPVTFSTTPGLTDTQLRATALLVSGPLTDTQMRAVAVPVTFSTTPGLTDAQMRATAVPVSFASTPGLTDTQMRATPVPTSFPTTGVVTTFTIPVSTTTSNWATVSSKDVKLMLLLVPAMTGTLLTAQVRYPVTSGTTYPLTNAAGIALSFTVTSSARAFTADVLAGLARLGWGDVELSFVSNATEAAARVITLLN